MKSNDKDSETTTSEEKGDGYVVANVYESTADFWSGTTSSSDTATDTSSYSEGDSSGKTSNSSDNK
jgi:hypothetical protein